MKKYIVNTEDFIEKIDQQFWNHITKESSIRDIVDYQDVSKKDFITNLSRLLNNFEHSFEKPDYIYAPKRLGILRKKKIYNLKDTCIYYYCVKSIQDELSSKIKENPNVFGGFRFSPDLKIKDEDIIETNNIPFVSDYSGGLAKFSFRKEWSDYQKLAYSLIDRDFNKYIHLDIAHFYDDINLHILENKVRSVVQGKSDILDLLFYFLKYSDKRDLGYQESNVGIPQEDLGEMSRLLANFYLYEFDKNIIEILGKMFSANHFFYTRYADDMWFCFNSDNSDEHLIIQKVSIELQKIKLHLNEGKILILNKEGFCQHWHFDKFEKLLDNKKNLHIAYNIYNEMFKQKKGRWYSVVNYAIKIITSDRKNISIINDVNECETFINSIIRENPRILPLPEKHRLFFVQLMINYPIAKEILKNHLSSKDNIYPNVEFFILELLSLYLKENRNIDDIDFFLDKYFKSVKEDYQWYSRCLCIKTLIDNIDLIERNRIEKLKKIINHIGNSERFQSHKERRFSIRFLSYLRDRKGEEALQKYFIQPEDIAFLNHLKSKY